VAIIRRKWIRWTTASSSSSSSSPWDRPAIDQGRCCCCTDMNFKRIVACFVVLCSIPVCIYYPWSAVKRVASKTKEGPREAWLTAPLLRGWGADMHKVYQFCSKYCRPLASRNALAGFSFTSCRKNIQLISQGTYTVQRVRAPVPLLLGATE